MTDQTHAYEQRLILFLDFLGFRDIVAEKTTEPGALRKPLAAIDFISYFRKEGISKSKRVSQFSEGLMVRPPLGAQTGTLEQVRPAIVHEDAVDALGQVLLVVRALNGLKQQRSGVHLDVRQGSHRHGSRKAFE